MKVTLFGYGKMGKLIEECLIKKGHEVAQKFDAQTIPTKDNLTRTDVIIDFSIPSAVESNLYVALELNIPLVIGTTGWYQNIGRYTELTISKNGSVIYGSNFSIAVNLFYLINTYAAKVFNKFPDFEASVHEVHHIHKKDAPSGTGIAIANQIILEHSKYTDYKHIDIHDADILKDNLSITSDRTGEVIGFHEVSYKSQNDIIKLSHDANSRIGFAEGAVLAAEMVTQIKGFVNYQDVFTSHFFQNI